MRLSKTLPLLLIGLAQSQLSYANDDEISDDEIIVTAKRYAEPAKNYAGSVSVLSAGRLQKISAVHPAEALNEIAGVNIHRGSGQEHLTAIRSPVLTGGAGAGSFLYLEDGVPLRAAGFA
ncbi:TonB-dependent receptor plug domain-containing protein, partial [bacterium AH-315-J19]|nr:TonB-dependent receptor plug domain-containing protein [bacterium AH-315-J19]